MRMLTELRTSLCASEKHTSNAPAADNLVSLAILGDKHPGFPLCNPCLLAYVDAGYIEGARLAFTVQPL